MALAPVQNSSAVTALLAASQQTANTEDTSGQVKASATKTVRQEESKLNFFEQFKLNIRQQSDVKPSFQQLEQRASDIRRMGAFLEKHPMPEMVKDYVGQVRDLMNDLRDSAYSANKRDGLFQKIDVIDDKLDALADKVLSEEKDGLQLAHSLGELQGLLIDVFV